MFTLSLALFLACSGGDAKPTPSANAPAPAPAAPAAAPAGGSDEIADTTPVASWEGGSLTYAPVRANVGTQLIKLEADFLSQRYDTQEQEINDQVNEQILKAEAKKRGLADEMALLKVEVEDKIGPVSESELQEAYAQLARRLGGRPLDDVRPQVEQAVVQKKKAERFGVYMQELRDTYKVKVTLPFPDLPRFPVTVDDDPFEGAEAAPVTIVQFAEFQCPYCGKADEVVKQVLKNYEGKVKVVFRDFPLGFHENAIPAAVAANCAGKQGKYWEYHRLLMSNQRALSGPDLERAAQEVGLNSSTWQTCIKDPTMEAEVRKDMEDGAALGVQGTPAFFVNGIFLNGAQPYEKFQQIIDRELAQKG